MENANELLTWLNALLALEYTSVQQCGSGAAFCQVLDSLYLDIPMSRVRFSSDMTYHYTQNYKAWR
ncbi:MAG: hypothetical protein SGCHY_004185, partial [Lobulomycetales sp.]